MIDIQRALVDFDGNAQDVGEVLLLFLDDLDLTLNLIHDGPRRGRAAYAALLHESANSLESAWCFRGGQRVRALEHVVRGKADVDYAAIKDEVSQIMVETAEHARAWLRRQLDQASGHADTDIGC